MNSFIIRGLALVGVVASGASHVATDLAPITAAGADALAVAGALMGIAVSVWAAQYVRRKFFG